MRILIQRVLGCKVETEGKELSSIGEGILIFLGITFEDGIEDVKWLANKAVRLRIFDDEKGVMNLSTIDLCKSVMLVSQFTLHASTKKGNRPSYIKAAPPEQALPLYNLFIQELKSCGLEVATGKFGANMNVRFTNSGPVTILVDSKNKE